MNRLIERHVVVCVDDEPAILSALKRALRHEPYEVFITEQPERALKWVTTRDVSLIISDQRMPAMKGIDLLEEVSKRSPSTARVMLTAYPGEAAATPGVRSRLECMISKPWDASMLKRTIRQLLLERELGERVERDETTTRIGKDV